MILLLGDYSSVHYELSEALKKRGFKVLLISDGDDYKKIKCDVLIPGLKKYKKKWVSRFFLLFRFFGVFGFINYLHVKKEIDKIQSIRAAQIINPVVIPSLGGVGNIMLIRYLSRRTPVLSLCALGDDHNWVSACAKKRYKYSALDRFWGNGVKVKLLYLYSVRYIFSPLYVYLDKYARRKSSVIIPGLSDYQLAHEMEEKLAPVIPLPVSPSKFSAPVKSEYPLNVFHAWQAGKEHRKGNDVLDRMVKRYISEFGEHKVKYEIVSGLTYEEYLKKYTRADIILDQIYSYDRGMTGVLGMAAGKVVFSGFEEGHFEIGVNATPNENYLYNDFVKTIHSLSLVDSIKKNAFEYSLRNHDSNLVAEQYLRAWGL